MSKKNLFTVQIICILFLLVVISCNDSNDNDQETEKLRKEVSELKKEKDAKTEETKKEQKPEETEEEAENEPENEPKNDEQIKPKNNPNIVTAKQVNGTWSYSGNRVKILAIGGGTLKMQLESKGEVNSVGEAYIDGTEGTYAPFDGCNLTLTFGAGYLDFSIDSSKGGSSAECGDFEGRYEKTNSAKPTFEKDDRWKDAGN